MFVYHVQQTDLRFCRAERPLGNDNEAFGNSPGVPSKEVGNSCPSSFVDAIVSHSSHVPCGDGDRHSSHFCRLRENGRAVAISTKLAKRTAHLYLHAAF